MNNETESKRFASSGLLDGFTHTIDGKAVGSDTQFDVINPSTGTPFARCPDASQAQLDEAVTAARKAQKSWAKLPVATRRDYLHRLADALRASSDEIAPLLTREQGKPLARASDEITRAAGSLDMLANIDVEPEVLRDDETGRSEVRYRPLGVVGAITPWNVPLVLAVPKIAQALITGNTIIVKPSPYTPLSTLELGRIGRDILPPGVLNVVAGGNDLGRWMTEHPGIDKISFTGSVATGKRVAASAAGTLKRVTLELGGNDAAIVLQDAKPREIAARVFWGAFSNSGQICMAIKRLYVHESIYDEMCDELAKIARAVKVGDGMEPGVEMGPVQNRMQFDIVRGILEDTKKQPGVRILAGGEAKEGGGYFVQPTIVAGLKEGTRLVDEEPFGPVLPVIRYSDVEDVIERANATHFGLGGSVWTSDIALGKKIAERLDVGTAWVNQHIGVDMLVPFGGAKQSGIGREYSSLGLKGYMEAHVVKTPVAA